MTTAARPTWVPAKGAEDQGGARMFGPRAGFSSKDAPAHTMMKSRQEGQDAAGDLSKRDLKAELLERETKHFADKPELLGSRKGPSISASEASELSRHLPFEESIDVPGIMDNEFAATAVLSTRDVDADEDFENDMPSGFHAAEAGSADAESDEDDEDEDDEDETAELLAELERIKKERAEEQQRKLLDEKEAALEGNREEILNGNPLLNAGASDFATKKRWDDDVVFRNQTRNEPKRQKRFINDTIRSDFHRRFLNKYIK